MYEVSKESKQEFKNGCTVWYEDAEECYWGSKDKGGWIGTCPYGLDVLYAKDERQVVAWLKFWDEDRDEYGHLIADV